MSTRNPKFSVAAVAPAAGPENDRSVPSCVPRPSPASTGRFLVFELIPQVMHHKCARAVLPNDVWRLLRKLTIDAQGKRCEECGSTQELECHEVWKYFSLSQVTGSTVRQIMKLVGLRSLCHLCHLGKHIGYAQSDSKHYQQIKQHLMKLYEVRLCKP
jgi:hypothetical protein